MCPNHLLYGVLAMVHATLKLQGMSCAACAHNIETAMQLVAGVSEGSVNYGAEQASVTYDPRTTSLPQIQAAIADAGYGAYPLQDTNPLVADDVEITTRRAEQRVLRRKVWVSGILSGILMIGGLPMMTGLHLPLIPAELHHPWVQFVLATPVQFWCGQHKLHQLLESV